MYKIINILYAYIHFTIGKHSEDKENMNEKEGVKNCILLNPYCSIFLLSLK